MLAVPVFLRLRVTTVLLLANAVASEFSASLPVVGVTSKLPRRPVDHA